MANKLATPGATIKRHLIKGMEDTMEEEVPATEEEFVTMVSAGLAATSPHMIAATVGALGRLVWEFHCTLLSPFPFFLGTGADLVRSVVNSETRTILSR